jgi:hypothetical protein
MKKRGCNIPISFRDEDFTLLEWLEGQTKKKFLELNSISSVVRRCIEIVKDNSLLTKKGE